MTRNLKLLTSALIIGTNIYLHPCLSSDLIEESSTLSHSGKFFQDHSKEVLTLQIPDLVKEQFENFVRSKNYSYEVVYENPELVMQIMGGKLKEILPVDVQEKLKEMGKTGTPGILHLKGLPIDNDSLSEGDIEYRVKNKGKISESLILGMANVMGCKAKPNAKEQEGRIIHNIAPVKGFEHTISSKGRDPFYLHTENAYEDTPPDFLMLYGLVGDPKALTTYHFIEDFLNSFSEEVISSMRKKQFSISAVKGYLDSEGTYALLSEEASTHQGTKLRLRLYQNMERVTPAKEKVSEEVRQVCEYVEKELKGVDPKGVVLNLGEALIFNNGWGINKISGIMHGRKGTIENPNRWLQRAFLFRNNEN